jgi:ribonucleoside-diphosphate reductase beta chain
MSILDPGFDLTLRPMKYPEFYDAYKLAIKNRWTPEEVNFSQDLEHLRHKVAPGQGYMIKRLVAFFATGDSIVSNNLVLNLYKHINSPEARLYYSRQLFEESVHVDFYLQLLESYIPDEAERAAAFAAVDNIPSIKAKADFALKWIDRLVKIERIETHTDRRDVLLGIIAFACAIEGLFFMGAFAYVYYLRSKGLLPGLAEGTDWVFRDESFHMRFAFQVIDTIRREYPELFDADLERQVHEMLEEAIACELQFAEDALSMGVLGFTIGDMKQFLQFSADQRAVRLGMTPQYNVANPFDFMILQSMQPLTNFFERRVTEYSVDTAGSVAFDEDF